jgi:hypothetical protein
MFVKHGFKPSSNLGTVFNKVFCLCRGHGCEYLKRVSSKLSKRRSSSEKYGASRSRWGISYIYGFG